MKKIFFAVMLMGAFCLLPMKSMAMVKVDENGNEVQPVTAPDEFTIMMVDEGEGQSGNDASTPVAPDEAKILNATDDNQTVSSTDEQDRILSTGNDAADNKDVLYESASANDLLTTNAEEDSNSPLAALIAGIAGISLGSISTILILKRK